MKSFLILVVFISSCKALRIADIVFDDESYEIINAFLGLHAKEYYYFDKFLLNGKFNNAYSGRYKYSKRFFKNADSICRTDTDTTRLKFFCPVAENYEVYENLLTDEDFNYIANKYREDKEPIPFNLNKITTDFVRLHSKEYYDKVSYTEYNPKFSVDEFPTIRIHGLYFTEDKQTAIVAYSIPSSITGSSGLAYVVFKKQRRIWWKYITTIQVSYS